MRFAGGSAAAGAGARHRQSLMQRMLNPWADLASLSPDAVLSGRIEVYSTTFGITSAVMTSISAAALLTSLPDHRDTRASDGLREADELIALAQQKQQQFLGGDRGQGTASRRTVMGDALGLPPQARTDLYLTAVAASFYAGVCGLGASTVCLAWNSVQPPGHAAQFAVRHGVLLTAVPFFSAAAVGLNALALCLALDATCGKPVSYLGFAGTCGAGLLVMVATVRGMRGNLRLRRRLMG